ncbi:MAG TPA: phosphoenolpyruvate carboxylase, partial [Candidatus Kerfeldbacteria bacterium]|nr:phosphoenolpyruvate carboxylase [Candidatus Kerfeldbacteria bacterium]
MRRIPAVMATQHPDNAAAPYWEKDGDGFVSAKEEVAEAYSAYVDLGVDEFMWDWEGKYVDEAVVERFFTEYHDYFSKHQLGKEKFLTFRIPNIWQEKGYSLARSFMATLTAADMAKDLGLHDRPLFEVILPMTTSAQQLMYIQKTFSKLAKVKHTLFHDSTATFNYIEVIPLVEEVKQMFDVRALVDKYAHLHKAYYKHKPQYLRPFLARSDPALVAGLIPAVIGNKVALSELYQWSERTGIPVYPIVGTGSLPFRGSCAPDNIDKYLEEYRGVRTITMQSAFRYDYPLTQVKAAIQRLQKDLPRTTPQFFGKRELGIVQNIVRKAEAHYREAVMSVAADMFRIVPAIPARRERRLHIGLLGYSRSIGKKQFPRAITFTAAMYSLGIPPELIGTGRTLRALTKSEGELVHQMYRCIEHDLKLAGRYLNKENLAALAKQHKGWQAIQTDIDYLEQYFGMQLGPKTQIERSHRTATSAIYAAIQRHQPLAATV